MKPPTVKINARLFIENDHDCNCEFCDEGGNETLEVMRSGWTARCCSRSSSSKCERSEAVEWLADHLAAEHGITPRTIVVHEAQLCPECEGESNAPKVWTGDRGPCADCENEGIVWDVEHVVDVAEARQHAASIRARKAEREAKAS